MIFEYLIEKRVNCDSVEKGANFAKGKGKIVASDSEVADSIVDELNQDKCTARTIVAEKAITVLGVDYSAGKPVTYCKMKSRLKAANAKAAKINAIIAEKGYYYEPLLMNADGSRRRIIRGRRAQQPQKGRAERGIAGGSELTQDPHQRPLGQMFAAAPKPFPFSFGGAGSAMSGGSVAVALYTPSEGTAAAAIDFAEHLGWPAGTSAAVSRMEGTISAF